MKVLNQRKTKTPKTKANLLYLVLTLIFFMPVSCSRAPENVLSQRRMIVFLSDLHKLDGALSAKGLTTIDDRENIYFYNALLAKHKISKEQFDSSLVWYTRNPKKFNKIYKEVLVELNKEDSLIRQIKRVYDDSVANADKTIDIWNKPRMFTLTKDSAAKNIQFYITGYDFFTGDLFELKFLHRSSPVDSAFAESAVLRIHYENDVTDSLASGLLADSLLRRYTMRFRAHRDKRVRSISGVILHTDDSLKRVRTVIDSLTLTYSYSPPVHRARRLRWQADTLTVDSAATLKQKVPVANQKKINSK